MRYGGALLLALLTALALTGRGTAAIIGVNARAEDANTTLTAGDSAGAPGYEQVNWNNIGTGGASAAALLDAAGALTGVTISYRNDFYGGQTTADPAAPDGRLMRGCHRFNTHGTEWVSLAGLTPGSLWDVVLYWDYAAGSASQQQLSVAVDDAGGIGAWQTLTEPDGDPGVGVDYDFETYVEAAAANSYTGNYFVWHDVTAKTDGSLRVGLTEVTNRPAFNALQLVPEPASAVLVLCGALALTRRGRRRA
jgi:hypothetical protein